MRDGAREPAAGGSPRYGILGGTFDPPHIAHLALAQEVYARLGLDRVYFVPAGEPPHKSGHDVTSAAERRAMVERAIAGDRRFALCTVDLDRPGPSYTAETLRRLRALWGPAAALDLIVGWDSLIDLPRWHDPAGVVSGATRLVAAHRPGYPPEPALLDRLAAALPALPARLVLLPVPQLELSGTELRQRVASSLPVRYLVPDGVERYIAEHGLYRAPAAEAPARDRAAAPREEARP
jgi:nicotinate-nucleotide adenylyltransferase